MQDTASQFVHLIWLFTTQPDRLRPGNTIDVPLALPRSVDRWVYDVLEEEDAVHAVRRAAGAAPEAATRHRAPAATCVSRPGSRRRLQYLPVRIRIHQDAETFVDLMIERPPLQAVQEGEPQKRPVP